MPPAGILYARLKHHILARLDAEDKARMLTELAKNDPENMR